MHGGGDVRPARQLRPRPVRPLRPRRRHELQRERHRRRPAGCAADVPPRHGPWSRRQAPVREARVPLPPALLPARGAALLPRQHAAVPGQRGQRGVPAARLGAHPRPAAPRPRVPAHGARGRGGRQRARPRRAHGAALHHGKAAQRREDADQRAHRRRRLGHDGPRVHLLAAADPVLALQQHRPHLPGRHAGAPAAAAAPVDRGQHGVERARVPRAARRPQGAHHRRHDDRLRPRRPVHLHRQRHVRAVRPPHPHRRPPVRDAQGAHQAGRQERRLPARQRGGDGAHPAAHPRVRDLRGRPVARRHLRLQPRRVRHRRVRHAAGPRPAAHRARVAGGRVVQRVRRRNDRAQGGRDARRHRRAALHRARA
mmetsp:Transcript_12475/g.38797  ORF Transcript_12475/g.38797 Transcript_12475/m.38797 type:complete len:369 (+) Transcript_12475:1444-2550(+)